VRERSSFIESHRGAALEIRRHQQRNRGAALQIVREDRGRIRLAEVQAGRRHLRFQNESADVQLLDVAYEFALIRAIGRRESAVVINHQQLPEFLIERHFRESVAHPAFVRGDIRCADMRSRSLFEARRFGGTRGACHQEDREEKQPDIRFHVRGRSREVEACILWQYIARRSRGTMRPRRRATRIRQHVP
jgi:hypothetical protein